MDKVLQKILETEIPKEEVESISDDSLKRKQRKLNEKFKFEIPHKIIKGDLQFYQSKIPSIKFEIIVNRRIIEIAFEKFRRNDEMKITIHGDNLLNLVSGVYVIVDYDDINIILLRVANNERVEVDLQNLEDNICSGQIEVNTNY